MRIRAAIATVLLGLTVTSCSSKGEAAPNVGSVSTTTSSSATSTTTTPAPSCRDFPVSAYVGETAKLSFTVEPLGWKVSYANANPQNPVTNADAAKITAVDKKPATCQVVFTLEPTAPAAPPEPPGLTDGTYLVGTDMEAGSYKSPGGKGCYWARLKDDSGQNIIANNLGDGPARFTAKKGEYVQISRCTFTKV